MGLLVDGKWVDQWYDTESTDGKFERQESQFRNQLGSEQFPIEKDRYHLYVSYACPWAHRTIIYRQLKNLADLISLSAVDPLMEDKGWQFGKQGDPLYGFQYMHQIYTKADPNYTGRVTVPVLWDKKKQTIVNNESAEIIRMFDQVFDNDTPTYYPDPQQQAIDELNEEIYHSINNGVYKAGFATTQQAYDEAVTNLFSALEKLEKRLGTSRYLHDDTITESDWRLFTTLVRFDAVYVGHFKCNIKRIADYDNLSTYLRDLYQQPKIADTVKMNVIKQHYYESHKQINPTGIIPKGPIFNLEVKHNRDR